MNEDQLQYHLSNFMDELLSQSLHNLDENMTGPFQPNHLYPVQVQDLLDRYRKEHNSALLCYLMGARLAAHGESQ